MQNFLQFSFHKNSKNIAKNFKFDSRNCKENSIFIALETGDRSGVEFISNAILNGAICVVSQSEINNIDDIINVQLEEFPSDFSIFDEKKFNLIVSDTLIFIQDLARERFKMLLLTGIKTIAVTGSVGKTTTKEIIANTLSLYGKTHANFGNYNNHIGVPITILNCPIDARFLVLEMGMNHVGEIKELVEIAPCDFRIITNSKENHAGNFQNGLDGVLEAKFEIMEGDRKFELFIVHELFERFQNDAKLVEKYSQNQFHILNKEAEVLYEDGNTAFIYKDKPFTLPAIYSSAQVQMFCLSIALMESVIGQDISYIVVPQLKGRGNIVLWNSVKIIDESYNASPSSMKNALENFKKFVGSKLCILGDMRELGTDSERFHQEIAEHLQESDYILVGEHFASVKIDGAKYFENYESLKVFLETDGDFLQAYQNILVKASNGTLLWKLFDDIFK